jgi:RepB DNA-primase from phage plasmid
MDRTEITVRNMLQAIKAPLYDIGVLSNRGMLPGLDSIPAEDVLKRLSLLKYRNARGSHIYVRPSGEHRYTVLDDLNETVLMRLAADGFNPCAIIETSAGNFQAWLKHRSVFPKLLGTFTLEAGSRLVQAKIAQTDFTENTERPGDLWLRNKEVCSHIDRHSQTSATLLSRYLTSRVFALNRLP